LRIRHLSCLKLAEFIMLNDDDKAQLIWDKGGFLASLSQKKIDFILYSVFDFYVEFETSSHYIRAVRCFKKGKHLDKYLSSIDLKELLKKDSQ
jgi:hypothetical protein